MHLLIFNDIWHCLHLYNIGRKTSTWSFNRLYIVQSSRYTSRNWWINSLNAAMTTLENILGAFFNPNDMIIYWYDPHSVEKVVLYLSSGAILI
jgi:hypothetical protein